MRNPKIIAAFAIGCAFVLLALVTTQNKKSAAPVGSADVVVAKAPEREPVRVTDVDGDGVPDWQNMFTEDTPLVLEAATSSEYKAPDTLTGQLAVSLLTDIVENKTYGEFAENPEAVVAKAQERVAKTVQIDLLSVSDIPVSSDNSREALLAYEAAMQQAYGKSALPADTRNEVAILQSASTANNPAILKELDVIINAYADTIAATKAVPVPKILLREHLNYLNALRAVHQDIVGMKKVFSDPVLSALLIKRYPDDIAGLRIALDNLAQKIDLYKVQ